LYTEDYPVTNHEEVIGILEELKGRFLCSLINRDSISLVFWKILLRMRLMSYVARIEVVNLSSHPSWRLGIAQAFMEYSTGYYCELNPLPGWILPGRQNYAHCCKDYAT
jgi:hypothetical protein